MKRLAADRNIRTARGGGPIDTAVTVRDNLSTEAFIGDSGSLYGFRICVDAVKAPLPIRWGLSNITSCWGMFNRRGANAMNTAQKQRGDMKDRFGGFRITHDIGGYK